MRVLYDSSLASNPAGTGAFVRGLEAALRTREDLELVTPSSQFETAARLNVRGKRLAGRLASAFVHLRYYAVDLPAMARRERCDAIFCPSSLGPLRGSTPSCITLFDLSPLTFANTVDRVSGQYLRFMLRAGIRRACGICTISHAVAEEIVDRFPRVRRESVRVAYPGPNPALIEATPIPIDIGEAQYALMVGTIEPRKNHITVLRALADHLQRRPRSALRLVLAGSSGWRYAPVLRAINELGLATRVLQLGEVDAGTLRWLYEHAEALLFPSLYEGFGLPVLEAFTLGCPVVAARIPSIVEIAAGDAAMLLEPTEVRSWTDAIDRIEGHGLDREAMIHAGRRRAQQFTWAECAASVMRLLVSAARDGRRW